MPKNKFQGRIYALITVLITVPCFVVYCLSYESGGILNINWKSVLVFIPIEVIIAFLSVTLFMNNLAQKLALKAIDPKIYLPRIVQSAIICTTVCLMCPWMSFIATIIYKGIIPGLILEEISLKIFLITFIPNFCQTVVINFPFAFFSQLFFIQPLTRKLFRLIFKIKD